MSEIDVSKCVHFYAKDKCKNTCHWFCTPCEWVDTKECTYKQLQQLKQENEEIRKINDANAKLTVKLRDCLEEIEGICIECDNNSNCLKCKFYNKCDGAFDLISQLIKQAKEGE